MYTLRPLSVCLALAFLLACQKEDGDVRAAAMLLGAVNALNQNSLSESTNDGLGGAVSALSSASSGLSTGTALLGPWHGPFLRPRILEQVRTLLARSASKSTLQPAAFQCDNIADGAGSGPCGTIIANGLGTGDEDYIISGNRMCGFDMGAGSVAANDVELSVSDLGDVWENTLQGKFNYTKCRSFHLDYNDLPNFTVRGLNGSLYVDGYVKSTLAEGSASVGGLVIADTVMRAGPGDRFSTAVKDGGGIRVTPTVMDIDVNQTMSLNILFDVDGNVEAGLASGVIYISGTVNGESVDQRVTFAEDLSDLVADDDLENASY